MKISLVNRMVGDGIYFYFQNYLKSSQSSSVFVVNTTYLLVQNVQAINKSAEKVLLSCMYVESKKVVKNNEKRSPPVGSSHLVPRKSGSSVSLTPCPSAGAGRPPCWS